MRFQALLCILILGAACTGCGTSQWSDTKRTATEQLLISDAVDRAVSQIDLRALAGKPVYLDDEALTAIVDRQYLSSSLRQHMLASGCILKLKPEDAEYILEARAGAVGTDRHDVLYGVPAVNLPVFLPMSAVSAMPSSIPEIPFVKKTDQRGVAKIAMFAYNRRTGRPVWQSGIQPVESRAKDVWVFGAGPFQQGTIYEGVNFAGDRLRIPLISLGDEPDKNISVASAAYFVEPEEELTQASREPASADKTAVARDAPAASKPAGASAPPVTPASHTELPGTLQKTAPADQPSIDKPSPQIPPAGVPPAGVPSIDPPPLSENATVAPFPPLRDSFLDHTAPRFPRVLADPLPAQYPATPFDP